MLKLFPTYSDKNLFGDHTYSGSLPTSINLTGTFDTNMLYTTPSRYKAFVGTGSSGGYSVTVTNSTNIRLWITLSYADEDDSFIDQLIVYPYNPSTSAYGMVPRELVV